MSAQELENTCGVRLKFASLLEDGTLVPDCHEEYDVFAKEAPDGWSVEETGMIETRHDHQRQSWVFTDGSHEIAAVEHETGVEILVGVGVKVASAAILTFAGWAWQRWRPARQSKPASTLIAERIEERLPDGTERVVKRILVRPPVTEQDVARVLGTL